MNKVKSKFMELWILLLQTAFIAGITIFSVLPLSCKVTTEGIEIIGADYTAPVLESLTVLNDKTLEVHFSESVKLTSYVITPVIENVSDSEEASYTQDLAKAIRAATDSDKKIPVSIVMSPGGNVVTFILEEKTCIGKKYQIYGSVEDKIGNTMTFCIPFTGYNSAVPDVIMSEVQVKYAKGTVAGEAVYRCEFVELLILKDGNLSGLEIISGMDGEGKKYSLPAIDVKRGEIITVHLRTAGEGCVNEEGDDLSLATAAFSTDGVRDLWSENTTARYHDTSDVIILKNVVSGAVMDAIFYAAETDEEWKSGPGEFAKLAEKAGVYGTDDISEAVSSKGCSPLKSFHRVGAVAAYKKVKAGGKVALPMVNDSASWVISAVSPGKIE